MSSRQTKAEAAAAYAQSKAKKLETSNPTAQGSVPYLYQGVFPEIEKLSDCHMWISIGDFGDYNNNKPLADAMEKFASITRPPDEIIFLGDEFYAHGPRDTAALKTDMMSWRVRFCQGSLLGVRTFVVLGNHSYGGDYKLLLNFSDAPSSENPTATDGKGMWRCRGGNNNPNDAPSTCYTFAEAVVPVVVKVKKEEEKEEDKKSEKTQSSSSSKNASAAAAAASSSSPKQQQPSPVVHFTVFDTNVASATQHHRNPHLVADYPKNLKWLKDTLNSQLSSSSSSTNNTNNPPLWRIVSAHHPCYNLGVGHAHQGNALRAPLGKSVQFGHRPASQGLGLLDVFKETNQNERNLVYISGHEHVCHLTDRGIEGIHVVSGAGMEWSIYGGRLPPKDRPHLDYTSPVAKRCFLVGVVTCKEEEIIGDDEKKETASASASSFAAAANINNNKEKKIKRTTQLTLSFISVDTLHPFHSRTFEREY